MSCSRWLLILCSMGLKAKSYERGGTVLMWNELESLHREGASVKRRASILGASRQRKVGLSSEMLHWWCGSRFVCPSKECGIDSLCQGFGWHGLWFKARSLSVLWIKLYCDRGISSCLLIAVVTELGGRPAEVQIFAIWVFTLKVC